jgi:CRISPR type III-A-associated protein Csm2
MPGANQPNDSRQRARPPHGSARPDPAPETKWPDCLEDGYFDTFGHLLPGYVERERMEQLARDMAESQPALTMSQVRRFFQHCRTIEARLRARTSTWEVEYAHFRQLDVAAADAFGKSPKKIPEMFHNFVKKNVAAVRTEKDFLDGFLPHFEALVGFGAGVFPKSERN